MLRIHIMIRVRNLDTSIRFYQELFDAPPTVQKADYAKWMLEDPRINFSVAPADEVRPPGVAHLGLQAESAEELEVVRGRIDRAGGTVRNEGETTCCYANSDKTWVVDGQGVAWEAFYTHGESATYHGQAAAEPECCAVAG